MSWKFNPFTGALDLINDLYKGAMSAAPSSPTNGTMYFDTDDSLLYVYYGGSWIPISGGGAAPTYRLLLESGDNLAFENGDLMRTE